jgi:hypothetical protein
MRLMSGLILCSMLFASQPTALPTRIVTYKIAVGQTQRLWMGVNVSGKVNLSFRSRDGTNRLHLWWIKQPFGRIEQIGDLANSAKLDIPSLRRLTFSSELRASAGSDTVVQVGENVEVDYTRGFAW